MENLKPLPVDFKNNFLLTDIGQQIESENYDMIITEELQSLFSSPREDMMTSCFSITPFYYFDFLLEKNPTKIYDIGCGCNIWKKYLPQIVGIDPINKKADIQDIFNDDFVLRYKNTIESFISINALHFIDIGLIAEQLCKVNTVLTKNGRAFVTMNLARLVENTPSLDVDKSHLSQDQLRLLESMVRDQVTESQLNFICVDIDFANYNSWINGNIRLVFDKT
jgi:hypothetical protein